MVPACRTGLDVAFWLLEKAMLDGAEFSLPRLRWLLYLAQAEFAAAFAGRKLMPATFLALDDGPLEPTIDQVLGSGLNSPWSPEIDGTAQRFLDGFWQKRNMLPTAALQRLARADGAYQAAIRKASRSEIEFAAPPPRAMPRLAPVEPSPPPPSKPPVDGGDVRFTGDGRAVTRWQPRRRIEPAGP